MTIPPMVIRTFRPEDAGGVVRLWRAAGLVVPQNDPERDIARKLAVQPELFLVGYVGDRLVACVMAGYDGHRGWLNYLAVDPSQRRKGLGRRIVEEAELRLGKLGCPKINLQVRRSNGAVMEFYRKIGYGEDDVASMGKRLVRDQPAGAPTLATEVNALGQPVGFPVASATVPRPPRTAMVGRHCTVAPLDPETHAPDLWTALSEDRTGHNWTYLSYGPFPTILAFQDWMASECRGDDPLFHAILDRNERAVGVASYLRIQPGVGVIEVGHLNFSPRLQRTAAATEAMHLMMKRAFGELGYRRYEWKCDALNAPSRAAASRLGFTFEGVFRQATVYKGRNRDTAWFSILDREWPPLERAFEGWLAESNFDAQGRQVRPLSVFRDASGAPGR